MRLVYIAVIVIGVVIFSGCSGATAESLAPPDIESAVWFTSSEQDSEGRTPCVDVQLNFKDGSTQELLLMSVSSIADPELVCMGTDPHVEWVYVNGKNEPFKVSHHKIH